MIAWSVRSLILGVSLVLACFGVASAAPTPILNYQAQVTTSSGATLRAGTYTIVFKIYDAATGGNTLWTETHTTTIKDSLVSVRLGTLSTIDLDFNSGDFYLGVKIGSDSEQSPRKQLGAVPYAANAKRLDGKTVGTGADQILALDSSQNLSLPKKLTVTDGFEVSGGSITLPAGAIQGAAITDGAISTAKLADNAVTTAKISDGTIATGDLADSAITTAKVSDGTIAAGDLADSSVTTAKILDGTIAAGDLADSAVTTAKISDGTIATADLANSAVTEAKLSVADAFDFDNFADNLQLDAMTLIDLGNNDLNINMGGTGLFSLQDTDTDVLNYDPALDRFAFGAALQSTGGTGWSITTAGSISIAGGQVIDTLVGGGELRLGRTNATSIVLGSGSNDTIVRSTGGGKGLKVGDGATNALQYYDNRTSASVDFADTLTATCSQSGDLTFTGAALEDTVLVAAPSALTANTFLTGHVTAADTVRIQFCNLSGGSVNPAGATYKIRLMR